ncbi:DUF739 family protein [Lacrimispora aerotolerans]|uniref:DUF739 family protein n=1 Tax=Lacrimispora aerotolerans TaxID=36832 RepID=UPI001FA7AD9A|nr:DUF739 family protein [Lacrimispora aerotolerans]
MIQIVKNVELKERRKDMPFNYNKLRGKIIEMFDSQAKFADAMGWSERTTSLKFNAREAGNKLTFIWLLNSYTYVKKIFLNVFLNQKFKKMN